MAKHMKRKGRKTNRELVDSLRPNLSNINPENKDFVTLFYKALLYAHQELNDKAYKKEVIEYAKKNGLDHKAINALQDNDITLSSVGKYCYLLNGGAVLPESHAKGWPAAVERLMTKAKEAKAARSRKDVEDAAKGEIKAAQPKLTVQDRMRDQAAELASDIDVYMDKIVRDPKGKLTEKFDVSSKMQIAGFKAGQARHLSSFYTDELAELKEALEGKDEQLKEGYRQFKKPQLERMVAFLESVVNAASMTEKVSKTQRKARKKKTPTVEKVVSKIKYLPKFEEFGLVSEPPESIVGATEVWVYNTKKRKLGKYVAEEHATLSCKGSKLVFFNPDKSVQKALRKPKDQLKEFSNAGKVQLRKFLENIRGVDTKLNGKLGPDVIILRTVR
jgi:hypothetical protein